MLDDLLRRAAQDAAIGNGILYPRQLGGRGALWIAHDLDLLVAESPHQPQLAEHFHIFFVIFGGLADPLLPVLGEVEMKSETQPLPPEMNPRALFERLFGDLDVSGS